MNEYLERDAVISACERYRYLLRRVWDFGKPRALFVMLNPSTADADVDDPTIRSCVRLSCGFGYGSFEVVNLYGFRSTDPRALLLADDPIGRDNDKIAEAAINRCDLVICAWGAHAARSSRPDCIWQLIRSHRPAAFCLGVTKNGDPKHPLYIKSGTPLETFYPRPRANA